MFLYQGKNVDQIEPDFFIVNVAHGQPKNTKFNILNGIDFPVSNRAKPQKPSDVADYFAKTKNLKSYERYANFHFLLYLAKIVDIQVR